MMKRLFLYIILALALQLPAVSAPLSSERGQGGEAPLRWRGIMIDVSRHFFPIEELYRQVDIMGNYGFNTLHLHLTDAAGWRMEIKRYPRLTEVGAWRTKPIWKDWWFGDRKYSAEVTPSPGEAVGRGGLGGEARFGGYYTQEQLREFVAYAQKKGITVVPEIEFPGHSEEVCAAYPEVAFNKAELDVSKPETYEFMRNVLREVVDVFPSAYIHCGGDETATQKEAYAQAIRRMNDIVRSFGRKMIVWDEALDIESENFESEKSGVRGEEFAPDSTIVIMVWRGQEQGQKALDLGHEVIMCPGAWCYLDSYQDAPETQPETMGGYRPLEKSLSLQTLLIPLEGDESPQRGGLLGLQTTIFTEYVPTTQLLEYQLWPRSLAVPEIAFHRNRPVAEVKAWAMHVADSLRAAGVNAFDLHKEIGERPEYAQEADHLARGCRVAYNNGCHYGSTYSAGGDAALTDGLQGTWNNNDGRWQGFCCDMDITIDLGRKTKVSEISIPFMQLTGPWIYLPASASVIFDGEKEFPLQQSGKSAIPDVEPYTIVNYKYTGKQKTRYITIKANRIPKGGWLFVDEIKVK